MGKILCGDKIILSDMKTASSTFKISIGLMFARKKKIHRGLCLVMPLDKDVRFGAAVTMWFCFHKMEILFVNTSYEVVDKVVLKPWKTTYVPKSSCKYVIESSVGRFDEVKIGDKIKLELS